MFQVRQSLLLFITAVIWGSGFVAQSIGMDYVSPFTFTFFRTLVGAIFLLPIIYYFFYHKKNNTSKIKQTNKKDLIIGSISCGIFLLLGESLQQFGLVSTDAGKAGFITSMYIIFVPVFSLFIGKRLNAFIIIGIVLSLVGLYLLCIKNDLTIESGDIYIFLCAIAFSFHILVISVFVEKVDGLLLSCGQFFSASFFAFFFMWFFGNPSLETIKLAMPAILYVGIMSNGIAYTLQVIGQRGINPTIATLILSLESVMAVVFGMLFLNESLTNKELIGCILMFIAVIIAQLPTRKQNTLS